ncbi:kelch domain-containing protein 2 [Parasteatoda tepidariorum]|uniref:kelch domain-containing protein 2 n=1 Tax=Parasteatoda tepidariorum TaxID=114398 RepID=UPI00077FD833|nr:kelch domain-containing protein 2 [Parasteatoda tepidariorum]
MDDDQFDDEPYPFQIQPSVPPARTGHVAVSFEKYMLVWGGYTENPELLTNTYFSGAEIWIYSCVSEKWYLKPCLSYQYPPGMSGSAAVVIDDCLYIFGGYGYDGEGCTNKLYRLDLETFFWEQLKPEGSLPTPVDKMAGWEYNRKFYIFGGFGDPASHEFQFVFYHLLYRGWTNQFFEYDPKTNRWTSPKCTGELPCARAAHAATVMKDKVYVFGGRHDAHRLNDLHCLDMTTMRWSGELSIKGPVPQGRSWHSLTALAHGYLILYGGFSQNNVALSDCWMFDTHAQIWQPIDLPFKKPRLWHCAVLSVYNEVLIYGGCSSNILDVDRTPEQAKDLIVISIIPKSLFRLCVDTILATPRSYSLWTILPHKIQLLLNLKQGSRPSGNMIGS